MGAASSKRRSNPPAGPRAPRKGPAGDGTPKRIKVTIDSDAAQSRKVQDQIIGLVEDAGFEGQTLFSIKLALEEAMINAIKHGNKNDRGKKVHIEASVDPAKTQISIEDQGPGFNRSSVPDPTLEENLCKCSGRGILLMESYMSSVKYSKNGRKVTMIKRNEPE